jgi:small subunit ribosomal protein S9
MYYYYTLPQTMAAARGSLLALRRVVQKEPGCVFGNASIFSERLCSRAMTVALAQTSSSRQLHMPKLLFTTSDSSRYFSSASDRKSMLRIHAVSLYQADYNDDGDDAWKDDPEKQNYLDPMDRRKAEEEEEATWWLYDGTQESRKALEAMRAKEAQKKRWIKNARPPVRVSEIDERGRAYGRGSRKTAQARVWIQPGEGEIVVNRKDFVTYFPRESDRDHVLGPFVASQTCGQFDVTAVVRGGGLTGQAGAIRLGLARALEKYNPDYRPPMKRQGFMTRDPRKVERKKVGRVKARKSPQWVRR